jgi:MoxR-like ATPase
LIVSNGDAPRVQQVGRPDQVKERLEQALFEIKRIIVGQDAMLERVMASLLAGGHLLLEGVPGLAKTLTIKTLAGVLGGTFQRIQFTPDLVPSDLVGTRIYNPHSAAFDTELGPVFCNFLLADEINRAPQKVQSALLEVMQEQQVTIGTNTYAVEHPFLVMATQNPIESEGTYPLPEAQVDRFMMKVVVGYPAFGEELEVVHRALDEPAPVEKVLSTAEVMEFQNITKAIYVDRPVSEYAVALANATRSPAQFGRNDLASYINFGSSPRGSINLIKGAQALALMRGRRYVLPTDVRDLAKDVLRHRMVLTYDALAENITADQLLDQLIGVVPSPRVELANQHTA